MAWPRSTHFGHGRNAADAGRKGGRAVKKRKRTLDYTRGYMAGWVAKKRHERKAEQ